MTSVISHSTPAPDAPPVAVPAPPQSRGGAELSMLRVMADDPVFTSTAFSFAAFVGAKALDKLPTWGVDRSAQLQPYADFFHLHLNALLMLTGAAEAVIGAMFFAAAVGGSRRWFAGGVGSFVTLMGVFLVGDTALAGTLKELGIQSKSYTHIAYALGAVGLYLAVLAGDRLRRPGGER